MTRGPIFGAAAALTLAAVVASPLAVPVAVAAEATATPVAPLPHLKAPTPSPRTDPHATDHVLVRFRPGTGASVQSLRVRQAGGSAIRAAGAGIDKVLTDDAAGTLRKLSGQADVAWAGYDYVRHASATNVPTDPLYAYQTYLPLDRMADAWSISTGSAAQVVAVVDTGVDPTAPDLAGHVLPGFDFVDDDTNAAPAPVDPTCDDPAATGHGTFVASVAAAGTDNGKGIAGAAWTAKVLPVRVLDACGEGFDSDIAAGVQWAADHGATVINLSLGGTAPSPVLQTALQYATGRGIPVVVAAGNDGTEAPEYPAAYPEAIAVAATDASGHLTYFSSYGDWVDVAAPGWNIVGEEPRALCADTTDPQPTDCYYVGAGTSFAAPIVSGVVALLRAKHPEWALSDLTQRLERTTSGGGPAGLDPYFGYGIVDAYGALGAPLTSQLADPNQAPNTTPATAVPFSAGSETFAQSGQEMWFTQPYGADTQVTWQAVPTPLGAGVDRASFAQQLQLQIRLYDSQRRLVGASAPVGYGAAASVTTVMPAGTDLVEVTNGNGSLPGGQPFTLTATTVGPQAAPAPGLATWVDGYGLGGTGVDVHPTVTFDRAMDATTLTATSVRLRNGISAGIVPASLSYDGPSRTLTVTPTNPLEPGTPYELTVNATLSPSVATDTLGNPAPALRDRFTTAAGTLPVVAGLTSRASKSVVLSWQMPDFGGFRNVAVYYKAGVIQPTSPSDGTLLYSGSLTSFTLTAPATAQDQSFSVFAYTQQNSVTPQTGVTILGGTTTLSTTPAAPVYGQTVTILATVRGANGQPMAGRSVTLFTRRPGHPWGAVGTATTTAGGQVSATVTPSQDIDVDAVTAGDATHLASTSLVSVPLRFSVTATTVPATAVVGSVTRFGGAVAPARPAGTVWLEGLWSGAWHFIGTATLTDHSSYSFKLVPTRVSTYVYRVYKPADATLVANATPSFTVVTHA